MTGPYDDIINLPHHSSSTRPRMSAESRAAQFSPFAALKGYDAAIRETGRLTDTRIELGEGAIAELDMKLLILADLIDDHPELSVTYFRPDERKEGGAYVTATGSLKKLDGIRRDIVLQDGRRVAIDDILDIECERFDEYINQ